MAMGAPDIDGAALDRHITGNYGEDQFSAEDPVDGFYCEYCNTLYNDEEVDTTDSVYECQEDGTRFLLSDEGSHRCPDCNKFASRDYDAIACPECGADGQMVKCQMVENADGDWERVD